MACVLPETGFTTASLSIHLVSAGSLYERSKLTWQKSYLMLPLGFSTSLSSVAFKGFRTLALIKQQFYYTQSKPAKKNLTDSKRRLQGSINSFTFLWVLIEVFLIFIISRGMLKRKNTISTREDYKPKMYYNIIILYNQFAYFCVFQILATC